MSNFTDRLRQAAGAAANIIKDKAPAAIEALEEVAAPETDFSRKLAELGIEHDGDAEQSALTAIAEAQAYALDLAGKVAAKQRTISSLQDTIVEKQQSLEEYIRMGASDQMFYLTEFIQNYFAADFDPNNHTADIIELTKKLLLELKQRREGKLQFVTRERFVQALFKALRELDREAKLPGFSLALSDEGRGKYMYSRDRITERIKSLLGLHEVADMWIDWVLSEEDELGLQSEIVGGVHYYGRKRGE